MVHGKTKTSEIAPLKTTIRTNIEPFAHASREASCVRTIKNTKTRLRRVLKFKTNRKLSKRPGVKIRRLCSKYRLLNKRKTTIRSPKYSIQSIWKPVSEASKSGTTVTLDYFSGPKMNKPKVTSRNKTSSVTKTVNRQKRNISRELSTSTRANNTKMHRDDDSGPDLTQEEEEKILMSDEDSTPVSTPFTTANEISGSSTYSGTSTESTEKSFDSGLASKDSLVPQTSSPKSVRPECADLKVISVEYRDDEMEKLIADMNNVSHDASSSLLMPSDTLPSGSDTGTVSFEQVGSTEFGKRDAGLYRTIAHTNTYTSVNNNVRFNPYKILFDSSRRSTNTLFFRTPQNSLSKSKPELTSNISFHAIIYLSVRMQSSNMNDRPDLPMANKVMVKLEGYPEANCIITDVEKEIILTALNSVLDSLEAAAKSSGNMAVTLLYPITELKHGQLLIGSQTETGASLVLKIFNKDRPSFGLKKRTIAVAAADCKVTDTYAITVPAEYDWDTVKTVSKERLKFSHTEGWLNLNMVVLTREGRDKKITQLNRFIVLMPNNTELKLRCKGKGNFEEVHVPFVGKNRWIYKYLPTEKEIGKHLKFIHDRQQLKIFLHSQMQPNQDQQWHSTLCNKIKSRKRHWNSATTLMNWYALALYRELHLETSKWNCNSFREAKIVSETESLSGNPTSLSTFLLGKNRQPREGSTKFLPIYASEDKEYIEQVYVRKSTVELPRTQNELQAISVIINYLVSQTEHIQTCTTLISQFFFSEIRISQNGSKTYIELQLISTPNDGENNTYDVDGVAEYLTPHSGLIKEINLNFTFKLEFIESSQLIIERKLKQTLLQDLPCNTEHVTIKSELNKNEMKEKEYVSLHTMVHQWFWRYNVITLPYGDGRQTGNDGD